MTSRLVFARFEFPKSHTWNSHTAPILSFDETNILRTLGTIKSPQTHDSLLSRVQFKLFAGINPKSRRLKYHFVRRRVEAHALYLIKNIAPRRPIFQRGNLRTRDILLRHYSVHVCNIKISKVIFGKDPGLLGAISRIKYV